ncbi:hypothetical protein [Dyella sp. AD56]|uniref:hypothetical protein n=1 Tax=Dyella sp. AD56 TaxID=1528744 RepID=UPI0018EC3DD6|nr:hypothetical protein [Dyella sp. AD56]
MLIGAIPSPSVRGPSRSHSFCPFFRNTGGCTARARPHITTHEDVPLAKPNYSFEKRQREIAKKKKQDNKQAKKEASRDGAGAKTPTSANASTAEGS